MTSPTCGCCAGTSTETPVPIANPPGLPAIAYRTGTYGRFLASMLARLSSPAYPALSGLTVRSLDDPATALLDGWAVVGDVLTFYTERIANEGYLGTATEDASLRLLGRLVGYAPRPGVAAGTYLAYTVDRDPSGRDTTVTVPRGSRAQSVPAPGEDAQPYETSEDLAARWSWNDLKVLLRQPVLVQAQEMDGLGSLPLAGTTTNLKPGDRLLFRFGGSATLKVVQDATVDPVTGITLVTFPPPPPTPAPEFAQDWPALVTAAASDEMYGRSRIVRRFVDEFLTPTAERAHGPAELAALTAEVVRRLDEAAEAARPYESVYRWFVERLRPSLAAIHDNAVRLTGEAPTVHPRLSTVVDDADDAALRALAAILPALRKPPSQPPASSRVLPRDQARIFGSGTDLVPQLLAALDPRLRDGLYAAWRHVDVTDPSPLQGLQALRSVANPFGATAPLQSVLDEQGRLVEQQEWPLAGTQNLTVAVTYDGDTPHAAEIGFTEDGFAPGNKRLDLTAQSSVTVGPWLVSSEPPLPESPPPPEAGGTDTAAAAERHAVIRFQRGGPVELTLQVSVLADDGGAHVTLAGTGDPFDHTIGDGDPKITGTQGPWQVTLDRGTSRGGDVTLHLTISQSAAQVSQNIIALDAVYDGIAPGSFVVIDRPRKGLDPAQGGIPSEDGDRLARVVTQVVEARTVSMAAFGISGKVTQLTLRDKWLDNMDQHLSDIRDAAVFMRGDELHVATEPVTGDVQGATLHLAQLYDGLEPGRLLVVTGERTDVPGTAGVPGTEVVMIAAVGQSVDKHLPGDTVKTTLTLANPLAYTYKPETVHVFGNVVAATQGASRDEPIGSGDASRANQSFTLFQAPLTWLAADTPLGAASTLEVRVDGVRWHEVDSFAGRGPDEAVYVTSTGEDGKTRVTFGDGVHGARLPTGSENVRAHYRVGIGHAGNVRAHQITQLATRPLGVSGVDNPVPATGGADPDDVRQARKGIPLAVTALDRLVGVPDYENFARARAGIGRASARQLFDGTRQVVHVTVAGAGDVALADDSPVVTSLRASLATFGDPQLPVTVAVRDPVLLLVAATVAVDADHSFDLVEPRIRAALLDRLGFAARELGQPAYLSEVIAAAQAVPGVDHVDVQAFAGLGADTTPEQLAAILQGLPAPSPVVPARLARFEVSRYRVGDNPESLESIAAKNSVTVADLRALNPGLADPAPAHTSVVTFRGVRPAQLVTLSAAVPDTLILKEARR